MEHFAGWKCPKMNYAHEIVGTHGGTLLSELATGAKPRSKTPCVYHPLYMAELDHEKCITILFFGGVGGGQGVSKRKPGKISNYIDGLLKCTPIPGIWGVRLSLCYLLFHSMK